MSTSDTIKKIRVQKDLSQEEMATSLNVTANYISLIENDRKNPGMPFLRKVSTIYKIPLLLLTRGIAVPKATTKREKEMLDRVMDLMDDLEDLVLNHGKNSKKTIEYKHKEA